MTVPNVAANIEVLLADGTTWISLSLEEATAKESLADRTSQEVLQHKALDTSLSALLASLPLGQKLESQIWTNRGGGIGIDYNAAYGLITRTPGIVVPSGAATLIAVPTGTGFSNTPLVAIEEFGGALFVAQQGEGTAGTYGGRILRSSDGTGTGGGAFTPVTFTHADYAAHPTYLTKGQFIRDFCLFGDGAGGRYLYASSSDVNGLNGRLHRTSDGVNWSSTAAGTFDTTYKGSTVHPGRNRLWRTFWTDRGGISSPRMFNISELNFVGYTAPGGDPFDGVNGWVDMVEVDTSSQLLELGGSKRHVFMSSRENVYDINEHGETPALTSYWQQQPQDTNGLALQYLNGYLYASLGRGLDRIYVDYDTPVRQESVGQCAPGWGTRAENDVRGYVGALCPDQGQLVAAVFNTSTTQGLVCWGVPKDQAPADLRNETFNPLLWYGPEVLFASDYRINRMRTSGLASGGLRLWLLAQSLGGGTPVMVWVSLPVAGVPLQDLISGGGMRFATGAAGGFFNPYCRLELMPTAWNGATEIVDQTVLLTRGLSVVRAADGTTTDDGIGTKLTYEQIADPAPGAITWPTGTDVTITPSQVITPSTVAKGERIWRRIKFFSPNGGATPPKIGVLDACRIDAWVIAPTAIRLPLTVQYGDGMRNLIQVESDRDPAWITDQLQLLTTSGRTTVKTQDGKSWIAKFEQVLDTHVEYTEVGKYHKRVTAKLSVLFLGSAA